MEGRHCKMVKASEPYTIWRTSPALGETEKPFWVESRSGRDEVRKCEEGRRRRFYGNRQSVEQERIRREDSFDGDVRC